MSLQVGTLGTMPDKLRWIPRTCKVRRKNQLLQVVLLPLSQTPSYVCVLGPGNIRGGKN